MAVGSHKDAFLAHQKVKKIYTDKADNHLPKMAAEILLEFVKSQRQIISNSVSDKIEMSDLEKYDREKVMEALSSVDGLCGKCNENHYDNCFVNQARRVLIAIYTGVDVKSRFSGIQSLSELLNIAEEVKIEDRKKDENETAIIHTPEEAMANTETSLENFDATFESLKCIVEKMKLEYYELKEKDIFRAALIDEVVDTIKAAASGNFSDPMPIHEDEQLGKIASAFNMMLETVDRTFKNLDAEVAKRSSELKMLMGSVKIGIMTINHEFRVNREYSQECLKIFECPEIGGINFFDLIHVYDSAIDFKENLKKFLKIYFENSGVDLEALNDLNPISEFRWNDKYLRFTMFPIFSTHDSRRVESVLIQVEDITANKLLENEINRKDLEARQIRKMVLDRDAFFDFMSESSNMLNKLTGFKNSEVTREKLAESFRIAHTIKGGAGCFELSALVAEAGKFEDVLEKMMKSDARGAEAFSVLTSGIDSLEKHFQEVVEYSTLIFGRRFLESGETEFKFRKKTLDRLVNDVRINRNDNNSFEKSMSQFYYISAGRMFAKNFAMVDQLANKLEKRIAFNVDGEDIRLPYTYSEKLSEAMLHILRNSIDHGIEPMEERLFINKTAEGYIGVKIEKNDQEYNITISDDGAGLNPEKIASKAIEKGLLLKEQANEMSEDEKRRLIFMPGFSTKSSVTTVSGRGIGMDIVKKVVEDELGGSLKIISESGRGTEFVLKFSDGGLAF